MENKRLRIWQWAVAALVLCNIALIVTIWVRPRHDGRPDHETPRDYVIRSLSFTDDQVKKYDELISPHQQAMRRLRSEARTYRQALFAGLGSGHNSSYTDSLTLLIANTQKQIETVTYDHFVQVRNLCTEEQKKRFDSIIADVIKKMNGGQPHHNGPGRGDDDHHPPPDEHGPPPPPEGR